MKRFHILLLTICLGTTAIWGEDFTIGTNYKVGSEGKNNGWRSTPSTAWTASDHVIVTQGNQVWVNYTVTMPSQYTISGNGWDPQSTTEQFGAIRFASGTSISDCAVIAGNVVLSGNARIGVRINDSPCYGLISGNITGDYQLELNSTNGSGNAWGGVLVLSGTNSYGATLVSNGTIQVGNGGTTGTLGTGAVTLATLSGLAFNRSDDYTLTNVITGGNLLTQMGAGTLTMNNNSGFTGNYAVSNGTLTWANQTSLSKNVTTSGTGTVNWGSVTNVSGTVTIGSEVNYSDLVPESVTFANKPSVVSGGVVNIGTTSTSVVLDHIILNGGSIKATSEEAMIINGTVSETISLIRDMPVQFNTAGGANTIQIAPGITTQYHRGISNYSGQTGQQLVKTGEGTLVVQGTCSYDGGTSVQAGVLDITGTTVTGNIDVASGATLKSSNNVSSNSGTISGTWQIVTPDGNTSSAGQISVNQSTLNKTFAAGSTLVIDGWRASIDWNYIPGVTVQAENYGQAWIMVKQNISNPFVISGTGWATNERRGAIRFAAGDSNSTSMTVLTGGVTLTGDATIWTHADSKTTYGAIASPITGDYTLGFCNNSSVPTNRLYLLGENSHAATTINNAANVTLGYTGTINGTVYNGDTGTLGTGTTTIHAGGILNYDRVNNYENPGEVVNNGSFNVNSGTFTLQNTLSGTGTTTVATNATLNADRWTMFTTEQNYAGTGRIMVQGSGSNEFSSDPLAKWNTFTGKVGMAGYRGGATWSNANDTIGMNYLTNFYVWDTGQLYMTDNGNYGVASTTIHLEGLGWNGSSNEDKGALRFNAMSTTATSMPVMNSTFAIEPFEGGTTRLGAYVDNPTTANPHAYGMIAGKIVGTADLNIRNNAKNTLILTGDNSGFSGNIVIDGGGTVQVGHVGTVNGVVYDGSAGSLGTGNVSVASGASLVFDRGTSRLDMAGALTNAGTVTVQSGTLSLAKDMVNSGVFNVNDGTMLALGSAADTTGQEVTISGAGTFDLDGRLEISVFAPNDYDTLTLTGQTANFGDDATVFLNIVDPAQFDGAYTLTNWLNGVDAATLDALTLQMSTPNLVGFIQNGNIVFGTASALPEPATWTLLLLGVGMLLRRRK